MMNDRGLVQCQKVKGSIKCLSGINDKGEVDSTRGFICGKKECRD